MNQSSVLCALHILSAEGCRELSRVRQPFCEWKSLKVKEVRESGAKVLTTATSGRRGRGDGTSDKLILNDRESVFIVCWCCILSRAENWVARFCEAWYFFSTLSDPPELPSDMLVLNGKFSILTVAQFFAIFQRVSKIYVNWRGLWINVIVKYVPFRSIFDSLSGNGSPILLSPSPPSTRWSSSSRSLIVPAHCLSARPMRRETVSWKFGVRKRRERRDKGLPSFLWPPPPPWPIASLFLEFLIHDCFLLEGSYANLGDVNNKY